MKKIFTLLFLTVIGSVSLSAQERVTLKTVNGSRSNQTQLYSIGSNVERISVKKEVTPEELLACPEGTALAGEFDINADYTGHQSSDLGRPLKTQMFQSFSGCYEEIKGIRFIGLFNFYSEDEEGNGDWVNCERNTSVPMKFTISFFKNKDGLPGEMVYNTQVEIMPEALGLSYGESDLYNFAVEFDEIVKMESGFFSVAALPLESPVDCWFALLCCTSIPGVSYIQLGEGEDLTPAGLNVSYCLKGTGKFIAEKSLKMARIMSPSSDRTGKYEKVQVELQNIGSGNISDARLELWANGELVATETVKAEIPSLDYYKYTFQHTVDCSAVGTNEFKIVNVTPGDEKVADETITFKTIKVAEGETCESRAMELYEYISNVTIGDINNSSEKSGYSDFTSSKTGIAPGEELTLSITTQKASGDDLGVWVDWNNNGSFSDEGDFISYVGSDTIKVKMPENVAIATGEKRMRIILSYGKTDPCGLYYYGETEDYTLVVERPATSPVLTIGQTMIEETLDGDATKAVNLELKNESTIVLSGKVSIDYALPFSPGESPVTKATKVEADNVKMIRSNRTPKVNKALGEDPAVQYTLRYDGDQYSSVGLSSGTEATYATYYPGEMLANLSGMKIGSVDVYIDNLSEYSAIVIYGQNKQNKQGELLVEQEFTPVAESWNTIKLNAPIEIKDKDLWIGAKFKGFVDNSYQIGTDRGPATVGFGDVVNVGGETWWSLADLGMNSNTSIRANVIGERTPAISWLSCNISDYDIQANDQQYIPLVLNKTGLYNTLYQAAIKIESNDILNARTTVPVYMNVKNNAGIENVSVAKTSVIYPNPAFDKVNIKSEKEMRNIVVSDLSGRVVKSESCGLETKVIDVSDLIPGIYLLKIEFAGNEQETHKITILK